MATELASATDPTAVAVPPGRQLLRGRVLLAFAAWNLWVWTTRVFTLLDDTTDYSVGFVVVHVLLFAGGFGGAAVLGVMGRRMVREARSVTHAATRP